MNVNQTSTSPLARWCRSGELSWSSTLAVLNRRCWTILLLATLVFGIGGSTPTALTARNRSISMTVVGWRFDFVTWELQALAAKARALVQQPAQDLAPQEATQLVRSYVEDARRMEELEGKINRIFSESGGATTPESTALQQDLAALRARQTSTRPAVEQVLQIQIGQELVAAGLHVGGGPFPPVLFTFTEPPKKLVVSPRHRIDTVYWLMLDDQLSVEQSEDSEQRIYTDLNLSAYITRVGGLGAYPSMVVDRASLAWILSTVAHEWVHNYLILFPLGWNYNANHELTTMNETVAEIVGNEIGERVLRRHYPDLAPPELPATEKAETDGVAPSSSHNFQPEPFDFRREMRKTRLEVDRLLAAGQVEEAESYMEERRRVFVEHGHYLRVLNQAYFAFHGSYGTSAASTSPIGPTVERLYAAIPDVASFMRTVRWFTSSEDLDDALARHSR